MQVKRLRGLRRMWKRLDGTPEFKHGHASFWSSAWVTLRYFKRNSHGPDDTTEARRPGPKMKRNHRLAGEKGWREAANLFSRDLCDLGRRRRRDWRHRQWDSWGSSLRRLHPPWTALSTGQGARFIEEDARSQGSRTSRGGTEPSCLCSLHLPGGGKIRELGR